MTDNEIALLIALIVITALGMFATRIAWRMGVVDGAQNSTLPHVAKVLRDEGVSFRHAWRPEKGGFNGPDDWPAVRPDPPPPMYRGSNFSHFDVDVPMPKGTAEPRA